MFVLVASFGSARRFGVGAVQHEVFFGPVAASPSRIHEEVADGGLLEPQLVGYRQLHLLRGPLRLIKDGEQRASLDVSEDQPVLLRVRRWPPHCHPPHVACLRYGVMLRHPIRSLQLFLFTS